MIGCERLVPTNRKPPMARRKGAATRWPVAARFHRLPVVNLRGLKNPLLMVVVTVSVVPQPDHRAVGRRRVGNLEAGSSRVRGSDSKITTSRGGERELLIAAAVSIPQLNLRAIARVPAVDVKAFAAMYPDDAVLVVA